MRKGKNPAKSELDAYQHKPLAIATILYIPEEEGYFSQSWQIFLYHLASVKQTTHEPFEYVVLDNGSSPEIQSRLEKLHQSGWIDELILSKYNLGKTGALNHILGGLTNEWICFADSDMLFRPGWLEESRKIDAAFDHCGMIGAQVVFPTVEVDKGNTKFRQTTDPAYVFEQCKADPWIVDEYCTGRGIKDEYKPKFQNMLLDRVTCKKNGVQVYLGGNSHQQWLAPAQVIKQILPLPATKELSVEEDTYQDVKIDELGYLHLTTTKPYLYHMGNTIDENIQSELAGLKLPDVNKKPRKNGNNTPRKLAYKILYWINERRSGHQLLNRLYDSLYKVLSNR